MTQSEADQIKVFVDSLVEAPEEPKPTADTAEPLEPETLAPVPEGASVPEAQEKPKDKRVVRAPNTGDKVYLLNEVTKEKRWISDEKVLAGMGFSFADVQEVEDVELNKYKLSQAVYAHNMAEA